VRWAMIMGMNADSAEGARMGSRGDLNTSRREERTPASLSARRGSSASNRGPACRTAVEGWSDSSSDRPVRASRRVLSLWWDS
jgi:hypothetical protein